VSRRNCRARQARIARAAAADVEADPRVVAVDVLAPEVGPREEWALDVVCADPGHTPLSVQRQLTESGAAIVATSPQGANHRQVLAVLEARDR